jgi:hypothetical protein
MALVYTAHMNELGGENPMHKKAERPPYLYHGSVDGHVTKFTPRTAAERPHEVAAIYASPNEKVAKQSMANKFVSNGGVVNGRHFVCIPMTHEEFLAQDVGGYVYKFPSDSFSLNEGRGFGDDEWVSNQSVVPLAVEHYPSLYNELVNNDIDVYFITPDQVDVISALQDDDPGALENFLGTLK